MKSLLTLLSILALPVNTFAHASDHATLSIPHFVTSPFHMLPTAGLVGLVTYLIAKKIYSKK